VNSPCLSWLAAALIRHGQRPPLGQTPVRQAQGMLSRDHIFNHGTRCSPSDPFRGHRLPAPADTSRHDSTAARTARTTARSRPGQCQCRAPCDDRAPAQRPSSPCPPGRPPGRRRGRRDDRCRPSLPPPRAAAAWRCGCGSGCGPHPRRARRHRSVSSPSLSSINQKFSTWRSRGQVAASGGCGPWISA